MNKYINCFNLYLSLFLLNQYRSFVFDSGSVISQIVSALGLLWSVYYFLCANWKYKLPSFFLLLNLFLLMITIYGVSHLVSGEKIYITEYDILLVNNRNYMFNAYHSLLPIYAFYYFARKNKFVEGYIWKIVILLLLLNTVAYWMNYQKRLLEAIVLGIDREEFTSNVGYFFLSVIPFLFFLRDKKILQYVSLVYLLYYILVSMKRGAILIGFLSVLYFFYMRLKNSDRRERYVVIVSTVAIIVLSFYFIQSFYLSSEYFQMRLESTLSGSASNRQDFYPELINYFFYNTSAIQFLLGSGADYTIRVIGNYAHNDWLEIAVNNGLLGLVLYLALFVTLWRNYMEGSLIMPEYIRNALFVTLLIVTLKTLFSMSYASFDVGIPICLGYCFAYISSKRNLLN